mgnify:CR=1 FL=1
MKKKSVKLYIPEGNILEAFYDALQCIERAYEIAVELPEHMPNYEAVKYKCMKVQEDLKGKINTQWHTKKEKQHYSRSMD